jgi:hypothetical protein
MKKVYKLVLILIVLSVGLFSCFPFAPYGYGYQSYRGQGYRNYGYYDQGYRNYGYNNQGYRGHGDRHNRHRDGYRDRGDWNYNSPHN